MKLQKKNHKPKQLSPWVKQLKRKYPEFHHYSYRTRAGFNGEKRIGYAVSLPCPKLHILFLLDLRNTEMCILRDVGKEDYEISVLTRQFFFDTVTSSINKYLLDQL